MTVGSSSSQADVAAPKRRWKRWVLIVALLLPVVYLAATFVDVWLASRRDFEGVADAIVVLGAAQYDGKPSPVLQERLDHAFDLWEAGTSPEIVLTGSKQEGDRFTEAYAGFQYLRGRGVPESDMVIVDDGTSTWESLAASERVLANEGASHVVLVSDRFHSARLLGVADDVGLEAEVSPTDRQPTFRQLLRETAIVAVGRIIGYRRATQLTE
jgi:vancomycin permeability regulator SanA